MHTIFDSLVTKENDHTNLLRNVMRQLPEAAACILTCLVDRDVSEAEAGRFEFLTQYSFWNADGRAVPDLLIEGLDFRCLIEAKINPEIPMTQAQARGYKECFKSGKERYLCFLVPEDWKHSERIEQIKKDFEGEIEVRLRSWREVIERLEKCSEAHENLVLTEVISFWKWRFGLLGMSDTETELLNEWSGDTLSRERFSAFRKLEKSINQAQNLFNKLGYETEAEHQFAQSYGFYIKRDRRYLLWLGIWTESPAPLSYGFHPTGVSWHRPNPVPTSPFATRDGYSLWPMDQESWCSPEKIVSTVKSFLDSQQYD